jgi:RNA polymerase sigma factor (sigma-70 family)
MEQTNAQRFEELFRRHYPAVRGYALRRTSPDAAQDAVAETFMVAWRRLDDVPDDELPWLFGVARRVLANQRRSSGRGAALEQRLAGAGAGRPASPEESVTESDVVRAALARLSERDREALMLVAWHGLTGKRAARAAGCTRAAFDVRLHRARRRLAAQLEILDPPPVAANAVEAS